MRCTQRLRRGLGPLRRSTLLCGAEYPLPPHFLGDLLVRDRTTRVDVREASIDSLEDIEVIEDVLDGAFVGQAIEELANGVLGLQEGASEVG